METLNNKSTGGTLTATEWNQVPSELQNVITQTGQILTNADLNQLGKGIAQYVGNGDFYTDSGAANTYVLTQIGTKQASTSYDDGMVIRFLPGNTNTTASTVNVATLGVKSIVNFNGDTLIGDEIVASQPIRAFFDLSNDRFQLLLEIGENNYSLIKSGRINAIINGGFSIAQRTTTISLSGFFIDRWEAELLGGSTGTFSQAIHTTGATGVPQEPEFFLSVSFNGGVGSNDTVIVQQFIENVRTFAGQTITLSFWAKSPTSLDISTELVQVFGGGGSGTITTIGSTKTTLIPTFQRITTTITVPTIAGKTIGTSSSLSLIFYFSAGSSFSARSNNLAVQTGTIDVSNVQLELGVAATQFENLTDGQQIELCQRYFEKSYDIKTPPPSITNIGQIIELATRNSVSGSNGFSYKIRKRTIPTITLFSPITGASGRVENGGDVVATPANIGETNVDFISFTGITGSNAVYHWTADAELS